MDYRPGITPQDPAQLPDFFSTELPKLQQVLNGPQDLMWLNERHVAPAKPRNGMIVYADGTDWNPGSGRGVYYYKLNTWTLLG